jgi:hypothetical protein
MSKFTDRLWRELMREHRAELERIDRPPAPRRRRALPRRLLAGTSVGLAGAGTAIALAIGAANTTPAFAVTKNPDGTVSVTINKLAGVAGANQRLAQMNVRAVAVPVVAGCEGAPPPAAMRAILLARAAAVHGGTVRIDPRQIPAGKSLVLAAGSGRVNIAQLRPGKSWTAPSCFRGVVGPVVCSAGGPPPGFQTNTTDTTGTDTAPVPQTNANTTTNTTTTTTTDTTTTTTGTTTGPVPIPRRFMGCAPPPCAAGVVGPAPSLPTSTATTGTTTAPPTATATTGTTTNTGTTGTTGAGRIQVPAPPGARFLRCMAPPRCAVATIAPAPRSAPAPGSASVGKLRAALANARAALARDHAALAKRHATR